MYNDNKTETFGRVKRNIFSAVIMVAMILSMSVAVLAAVADTTSFSYGGSTINGVLNVTWKVGTDSAYATTASTNSSMILGADIYGYNKDGALVKSNLQRGYTKLNSGTISCTASKFKSAHSVYTSNTSSAIVRSYCNTK